MSSSKQSSISGTGKSSTTFESCSQRRNKAKPAKNEAVQSTQTVKEIGGPNGLEPTRYGDWERKGRCVDF